MEEVIEKARKNYRPLKPSHPSNAREGQQPHSRSTEGIRILAQHRGMESGFRYAEAFQRIGELNRF